MDASLRELPEVTFLYSLTLGGKRENLDVMYELLGYLGNPHSNDARYVHVAGSNGKGSVCASVYSVLREKYHVGLYLSPHVYRFNERIMVDDREIEDEYIINFVRNIRAILEDISRKKRRKPSFFEVTTAMAFRYFKEKRCDFSIIEVGLGGRLDPTNVIHPIVSAITSIDLEHTDILGDT
ncbi:MAG: bifunctional folylpolyglutamate synthase/dihydrofolate synthase, partial [Thermoprotei archaeon]